MPTPTNTKPTVITPTPPPAVAPAPVPEALLAVRPARFQQFATDPYMLTGTLGEKFTGNPIGIPGNLYTHQDGAMALWEHSINGSIPLKEFKPGDEVWAQWALGVIGGVARMDCAAFVSERWSNSLRDLAFRCRDRKLRLVMYTPSLQRTPLRAVAQYCLDGLVRWAQEAGFDLCIDEGAHADDFAADLRFAGERLIARGRRLYLEGNLTPKVRDAVGDLMHGQFLERLSVERSFNDADNPDWGKYVKPNPAQLVIWDNMDGGTWSKPSVAKALEEGLGKYRDSRGLSAHSAIGAESWRIGAPGGPGLLVSRQDAEARKLLGVPGEFVPEESAVRTRA